ncbi:endolytic transglycosylase MltG [Brevibacillus sp. HD3.3A]|uniref:endolytic transglycosylase MltG n=1 Tax=Brevibacillus sp. HD3.3A TaxID=2738979 RepID=UPI00156B1B87|nr:endolytic transglycosylase MltG [Brevibacillus sp. HD3.3A]UED70957.1 endolytic transglycosylase MltG [Brevibacillus sp. HD3.3A]
MKPMSAKSDFRSERPVTYRRRRGGRIVMWLVALFLIGLLAAGGAAWYVYNGLQPVDGPQAAKNVTIPTGSSAREIGRLLEEQGLIRNADLFQYYVKYKGVGPQLKAGEYQFTTGQAIDDMLTAMAEGKTVVNAERFTIPEGWNIEQIAEHLDKEGIVEKAAFLKEVNEGEFPEFAFVAEIPKDKNRKHRLEGYLFPETYEVKKDSTAHDVVSRMLAQFAKEWQPEWNELIKQRGLTMDEVVNLASIVEREVTVDKERPLVAGVYFNRIRDKWPLQADATVQFILGKQRDRLTYDDLKVKSPYNTYTNSGLPPGPIANPGRASLAAVVNPAKHDFFFYVTKKDGTSEHYFSKTLSEHNANDAKSRGN